MVRTYSGMLPSAKAKTIATTKATTLKTALNTKNRTCTNALMI